jgi:hypothetical protein
MLRPAGGDRRPPPADLQTVEVADADAPSMLIASDLGRPTYERMGYLPMARFTLWAGSRAKGKV